VKTTITNRTFVVQRHGEVQRGMEQREEIYPPHDRLERLGGCPRNHLTAAMKITFLPTLKGECCDGFEA